MTCSEFDHLLDLHIDGELDEAQKSAIEEHVAQCGECRDKLETAVELQEVLSHMDDDISVPLPAQAAWRRAIREEAKRKRMKTIYTAFGAIAVVCVLTLGVTTMLQSGVGTNSAVQRVEADGVNEVAELTDEAAMRSLKMTKSEEYIERTVVAEDVEETLDYLKDVAAEYGAEIESEAKSTQGVNVFLQVPAESTADFIGAVDGIGLEADESKYDWDVSAATVGVYVTIVGA